ncbi:MAG TPA: immunoglobulin domain-containing protein [Planctomycetota bacterium]
MNAALASCAVALCAGSAAAQLLPTQAVTVDQSTGRLYVVDDSGAVLSSVQVSAPQSSSSAIDAVVTPDGLTALVTLFLPNRVDFFDLTTSPPALTGTMNVPLNAEDIDIGWTPSGFALITDGGAIGRVVCVNMTTRTIAHSIVLSGGATAQAVAVTHDGTLALVAGTNSNTMRVLMIDATTGVLTDTNFDVARGSSLNPNNVTISPTGRTALVTNSLSNAVDVLAISGSTVTYVTSINLGVRQQSIAFTPDGRSAYVYLTTIGVVAKLAIDAFDNVTDTAVRISGVGTAPSFFGVDQVAASATGVLYVRAANAFRVISTATDTVTAGPTTIGSGGGGVATGRSALGLFPSFFATPTSGVVPLAVQFTDRTLSSDAGGVTGWQWDLDGDSLIDSTVQHPSFVYSYPGRYHVSLTVADTTHGSRTLTRYFYITANQPARLEIEPNESKAQALANGPFVMNHGDRLVGTTTGTGLVTPGAASADTWLIRTGTLPPGIYRHRLVPTSTNLQHVVTLRTTSAANPNLDGVAQTSSTVSSPPRFVQWYGFGRGEKIHVRVTGTTTTTVPYTLTLETTSIPAQPIPGGFAPGNITLSSRGFSTLDNEITVFDGQLQEIRDYQNDDPSSLTGTQFHLSRPFVAGTYYLAVNQFQGFGTFPEASTNPGDPLHYYPGSLGGERAVSSPTILDFPDVICTSGAGTVGTNSFRVTDSLAASVNVTAPPNQRSEILWYRMQVGDPGCAAGGPPVITSSPPSLAVGLGSSVTLSVTATGTAPLSYQWWFNGMPIPALVGGTNPDLVLTNLDPSYGGVYVCQVSNSCGFANSQPALVTVHLFGPRILQHPVAATAHCLGDTVTFTVVAQPWFSGALSYQWYKNELPIPGATGSTLQFQVTGLQQVGQYLCRVTEAGFGFTDSSPALLTISNAPPVVTLVGDYYVSIECHVGTYTELGATVTDDCDPNLTVTISGTVDTEHVGSYSISYTATDSWGNQTTVFRQVQVVDTVPPTVQVSVANPTLWSPQHQLVNVGLSAQITDACSHPTFTFPYSWVEVYCNEDELADTGDGSGRHAPDAKDFPAYWSDPVLGNLRLRGERSALGNGRVYVIVVFSYDEHWNLGAGIATVVCPISQSAASRALVQAEADSVVAEVAATNYYWEVYNILANRGYVQTGIEPDTGPNQ